MSESDKQHQNFILEDSAALDIGAYDRRCDQMQVTYLPGKAGGPYTFIKDSLGQIYRVRFDEVHDARIGAQNDAITEPKDHSVYAQIVKITEAQMKDLLK